MPNLTQIHPATANLGFLEVLSIAPNGEKTCSRGGGARWPSRVIGGRLCLSATPMPHWGGDSKVRHFASLQEAQEAVGDGWRFFEGTCAVIKSPSIDVPIVTAGARVSALRSVIPQFIGLPVDRVLPVALNRSYACRERVPVQSSLLDAVAKLIESQALEPEITAQVSGWDSVSVELPLRDLSASEWAGLGYCTGEISSGRVAAAVRGTNAIRNALPLGSNLSMVLDALSFDFGAVVCVGTSGPFYLAALAKAKIQNPSLLSEITGIQGFANVPTGFELSVSPSAYCLFGQVAAWLDADHLKDISFTAKVSRQDILYWNHAVSVRPADVSLVPGVTGVVFKERAALVRRERLTDFLASSDAAKRYSIPSTLKPWDVYVEGEMTPISAYPLPELADLTSRGSGARNARIRNDAMVKAVIDEAGRLPLKYKRGVTPHADAVEAVRIEDGAKSKQLIRLEAAAERLQAHTMPPDGLLYRENFSALIAARIPVRNCIVPDHPLNGRWVDSSFDAANFFRSHPSECIEAVSKGLSTMVAHLLTDDEAKRAFLLSKIVGC